MKILFFGCLIFISYTYVWYPLFLYVLSLIRPKPVKKALPAVPPGVSIVIAARNEEKTIADRIHNLFEQDYPPEKMEIIVVSDGSDDNTDSIVNGIMKGESSGRKIQNKSHPELKLISYSPSRGKAHAINTGVASASGEVLVFTDCRQRFDLHAVSELVSNFSDPSIGCASGELCFSENYESSIKTEMGAYWNYEKWIRNLESRTGSVAGATGAIYSVPGKYFVSIPENTILDDVLIPMQITLKGLRVVFDPAAIAWDRISADIHGEWNRKVRTLAGNWQLLSLCPQLLSPVRNPLWMRFFSHKTSRLLCPFALILMLATGALTRGLFYEIFTALQIVFYITAAAGFFFPGMQNVKIVRLCYFFVVMNMAALAGFIKWVAGDFENIWTPEKNKQN